MEDKRIQNLLLIDQRNILALMARPVEVNERDILIGQLVLRLNEKQVTFNVFKAIQYLSSSDSYFQIDIIDHDTANTIALENPLDPLEACIMDSQEENSDSLALEECARYLQGAEQMEKRNKYIDLGTIPPQQPPSIQ
ncbi:Uncharacterized protein Adt_23478 [Abeliophyllum distichum]|uniref:Uncharacterized protein n=1 Tax=Abeliophyllum distichum TaxID=126358 RepID=A0ABD1SAZ5_9LAMI